jgi:CBS domain-containing protein
MKIEDVMTREVLTVRAETSLQEAAEMLARHRISGLPVVDADDHVVGVLSEGDILFKERGEARKKGLVERWLEASVPEIVSKDKARTVSEAMSTPVVTIGPRRPLAEAANTMIDEGVKRLPVVDDDGQLLGIVTRADLVRAFVRSDAEIAREIRDDVIFRALWIAPESIEVVVKDGDVRLTGEVETKADGELLPQFVQRVPGVVSVQSKLRWLEEGNERSGRLARMHNESTAKL